MFRFGDPGGRIYGSSANALALWTTLNNSSGTISVSAGNGRHDSGSSLRMVLNNNPSVYTKSLDSQATWGCAFAFKINLLTWTTTLLAFLDTGTLQVDLRLTTTGALQVTRNGTQLGITSALITTGVYNHVELKVKINGSTGTVALYINGVQQLNLTGQNTQVSGNASANQFSFGSVNGNSSTATIDFDDIILYDGQTTDANGFTDITGPIGDCGLYWLLPTGAGATTQWTPDTGSNYARVNEATPDGDTSYVEDATVSDTDTYACADLAAGVVTVKSVAQLHYAKKTDVGSRGMKATLRSGGGNTNHATEQSLASSYQYYWSTWGQNPNNGSAADWTTTTVNAVEIGQEVSS